MSNIAVVWISMVSITEVCQKYLLGDIATVVELKYFKQW